MIGPTKIDHVSANKLIFYYLKPGTSHIIPLKKMGSRTQSTSIRNKIRKAIEIKQSWEKKEYQRSCPPQKGLLCHSHGSDYRYLS